MPAADDTLMVGPVVPDPGREFQEPRDWLLIRLEPDPITHRGDKVKVLVPTGLRVIFKETREVPASPGGRNVKRDVFVIDEELMYGYSLKGRWASVSWTTQGVSRLVTPAADYYLPPARVEFSYRNGDLTDDPELKPHLIHKGQAKVILPGVASPILVNVHFMPRKGSEDFYPANPPEYRLRHKMSRYGAAYLDRARFAHTWFLIDHQPHRAFCFHVGRISLGCVSVIDVDRWDEIQRTLTRCRDADRNSVGRIKISRLSGPR